MLLSINWLRDYLQKSEVKIVPDDLAHRLTMRGLAVDAVKHFSMQLDHVLVGKILSVEPHPNADRLSVTRVVTSAEEGAEPITIVCGAKNIEEGNLVPVALPGAILPEDVRIKKSKVRGVESEGMICSGRELGINDDSDGILQLPKHAKLGEPVAKLLGETQEDTLLEMDLTPNRGDCLSIIGLAREAAPLLRTKVREPKSPRFRISPHRTSSIIKIEVEDEEICPRYVARVLDGLQVTESTDWIQQRLKAVGIRPINNIVDVTNFVMLEYGQPLHAFDLRKVQSGALTVARCKLAQDFTLLNGETVRLEPGDILIQDGETPVALAGIMGGANSQIEPDTTSIILESAAFPAAQVRKTAKRLGLHSDSSKRFEKGVDLNAVGVASDRAAALLRDGFNANVYHPPIDTSPETTKERAISLDMREVRRIIGIESLTAEQAAEHLDSIGIGSHKRSQNILTVRIPTFRRDLSTGVDIVEEVARIHGYDQIPARFPVCSASYDPVPENTLAFDRRTRRTLQSMGFRECVHYSFTSDEVLRKYGYLDDNAIRLRNPISEEMSTLRTGLLPSLLETYLYNRNRKVETPKIFELSSTFHRDEKFDTGVRETPFVAGLLAGTAVTDGWNTDRVPVNFFHGKGVVESLVRQLTTVYLAYEPIQNSTLFHPGKSATLKLGLKTVGYVGEIHPHLRRQVLESTSPLVLFELNLFALRKYERSGVKFKTPSKFPSYDLDIALVVNQDVSAQALVEAIKHSGGPLLEKVSIFDVYEGERIPEGKRSVAFHLQFMSAEKTLEDTEVTSLKDGILKNVSEKLGAELRT